YEVVQRLGAAGITPGEAAGERQGTLDEVGAGGEVAEARVAAEQALYPRRAGLRGGGRRAAIRQRRESVRLGDGNRPPGDERGTGLAGGAWAGRSGGYPRPSPRSRRIQPRSLASTSSTTSMIGRRASRAVWRIRSKASRSPSA